MYKFIGKYHNADLGTLLLRLAIASIFIYAGWAKIQDPGGTATFFASLGLGMMWVYVVAWVELLGGIAMLVGAFSRLAGLLLAADMAVAVYLTGWVRGFGGYWPELLLLAAVLAVLLGGPGKYALWKKWGL